MKHLILGFLLGSTVAAMSAQIIPSDDVQMLWTIDSQTAVAVAHRGECKTPKPRDTEFVKYMSGCWQEPPTDIAIGDVVPNSADVCLLGAGGDYRCAPLGAIRGFISTYLKAEQSK